MSKKTVIPQAALNQHIAALGKTGSGKSYAVKGIVEHLLDQKRQVCVLDPTGAWWGMRLDANGKGKGYDVVLLGGKHADIPLSDKTGAAVARLVTEQGASAIIDTTGFTVGEYTRWFIDFAGTLYTTIRNPLHLVIDEAHHFMPQGKAPDIDAGKMIHAGNRLMSGGRSLGIRGMLITQRPAKLHKDSLTCADTLIAMRVIAPQDRQAIKDWIDGAGDPVQGKAVLDSLAQLKRGEGWVWYPEGAYLERTNFPSIKTYDSSATPTHGAKEGPKVSEINLEEVKTAMAEAVKEAQANDPKLLRAELQKVRGELQKLQSAKPAPAPAAKTEIKRVEVNVVKAKEAQRVESAIKNAEKIATKTLNALAQCTTATNHLAHSQNELSKSLAAARREGEPLSAPKPSPIPIPRNAAEDRAMVNYQPRPRPAPAPRPTPPPNDGEQIFTPYMQDILDAAAKFKALGIDAIPQRSLAAVAKKSPRSSGWEKSLASLRRQQYVDYGEGSTVILNEKGRSQAAQPQQAVSSEEIIQGFISNVLNDYEAGLFKHLVSVRDWLTHEELGVGAGKSPASSGFEKALASLRKLKLVEYGSGKTVRVSPSLFVGEEAIA